MTLEEAMAVVGAEVCLCDATEDGEPIGWVACPASCCERPDHSHGDERQEYMGSGLVSPSDESAIERYMQAKDKIAKTKASIIKDRKERKD